MATVSATRAASTLPVPGSGVLRVAHGTYEHASNLAGGTGTTTMVVYYYVP